VKPAPPYPSTHTRQTVPKGALQHLLHRRLQPHRHPARAPSPPTLFGTFTFPVRPAREHSSTRRAHNHPKLALSRIQRGGLAPSGGPTQCRTITVYLSYLHIPRRPFSGPTVISHSAITAVTCAHNATIISNISSIYSISIISRIVIISIISSNLKDDDDVLCFFND